MNRLEKFPWFQMEFQKGDTLLETLFVHFIKSKTNLAKEAVPHDVKVKYLDFIYHHNLLVYGKQNDVPNLSLIEDTFETLYQEGVNVFEKNLPIEIQEKFLDYIYKKHFSGEILEIVIKIEDTFQIMVSGSLHVPKLKPLIFRIVRNEERRSESMFCDSMILDEVYDEFWQIQQELFANE